MKVNDKNTRIENLQNRQEKYGVPRVRVQLRQKFKKKIIMSSNFRLKLLLTVI